MYVLSTGVFTVRDKLYCVIYILIPELHCLIFIPTAKQKKRAQNKVYYQAELPVINFYYAKITLLTKRTEIINKNIFEKKNEV